MPTTKDKKHRATTLIESICIRILRRVQKFVALMTLRLFVNNIGCNAKKVMRLLHKSPQGAPIPFKF
ncbi:MAG: hypothetical protein O6943_12335, partial [Bacteroidetes bacterium]|nr:hypothetical protein [Bacteroidota bacterium]